jgi:hypothetical protein
MPKPRHWQFANPLRANRGHSAVSRGANVIRTLIPTMICIVTPNIQQSPTIIVQMAGRTSSNTTTYTETSAATVARNAPAALSNSVTSTHELSSKSEMPIRDAREGSGGMSFPKWNPMMPKRIIAKTRPTESNTSTLALAKCAATNSPLSTLVIARLNRSRT